MIYGSSILLRQLMKSYCDGIEIEIEVCYHYVRIYIMEAYR